jgi:hypothetical protein
MPWGSVVKMIRNDAPFVKILHLKGFSSEVFRAIVLVKYFVKVF